MAKKTKTINASQIVEAFGGYEDESIELEFGDDEKKVTVAVKKRLSLKERQEIVGDISDMVFIEDENEEDQYYAHLKGFAIKYNIITYFTNIKLPTSDANKTWRFLNDTDIVDRVISVVGENYINPIIKEALEMIEFKKDKLVNQSELSKAIKRIAHLIESIVGKIDGFDEETILGLVDKYFPDVKDEYVESVAAEKADAIK